MRVLYGCVALGIALAALTVPTPAAARAGDDHQHTAPATPAAAPASGAKMSSSPTGYYPQMSYSPMMYYPSMMYYQQQSPQQRSQKEEPLVRATRVVDVGIYDSRFEEGTVTVRPGTTVRWRNYGMHKHTVTGSGGQWDSKDLEYGQTFSATFPNPGRYEYSCTHHQGMRGTVVVQDR